MKRCTETRTGSAVQYCLLLGKETSDRNVREIFTRFWGNRNIQRKNISPNISRNYEFVVWEIMNFV